MSHGISSEGLTALAEQAARLIHSNGYAETLYPAQWAALRYFARALPASCTIAALARFQGLSLGPVARTVRVLVEKGLLTRVPNPRFSKGDLIAVTDRGRALLERDPRRIIVTIIDGMPQEQREALADAMTGLVTGLLAAGQPMAGARHQQDGEWDDGLRFADNPLFIDHDRSR